MSTTLVNLSCLPNHTVLQHVTKCRHTYSTSFTLAVLDFEDLIEDLILGDIEAVLIWLGTMLILQSGWVRALGVDLLEKRRQKTAFPIDARHWWMGLVWKGIELVFVFVFVGERNADG